MPEHWNNHPGCIRTASGRYVNILAPTLEMIAIEDIAHALCVAPRWGGHTRIPYSVAQHSLHVAQACPPFYALAGLLHDAAEAYLCDVPTPVKKLLKGYEDIEANFLQVIFERFGVGYPIPDSVKVADADVLQWEWDNLVIGNRGPDMYQHAEGVRANFLKAFHHYANRYPRN